MNKNLSRATILALLTAVISGFSNFINKFAVTAVKDPVYFTTLKNGLVAVLLAGLIIMTGRWREIKSLNKSKILKLFAIGLIGGSVPFALFFTGLSQTSAVNAGLIHKTLFIWVALLAIPLLKERFSLWQWAGVGAVFGANFLVGGFNGFKFNAGELMIFAATVFWAAENIIAKKILIDVSGLTVAGARMLVGSLFLLPVALFRGASLSALAFLAPEQWLWTALTVILLLAYVLSWYNALKLADASYVAALLVPATLVTNLLTAIFINRSFDAQLVFSSLLFVSGSALIITFVKPVSLKPREAEKVTC